VRFIYASFLELRLCNHILFTLMTSEGGEVVNSCIIHHFSHQSIFFEHRFAKLLAKSIIVIKSRDNHYFYSGFISDIFGFQFKIENILFR